MCGIVGLMIRKPELRGRLGEWALPMLIGMTERGPDSAGIAVFTEPLPAGARKFSLLAPADFDWDALAADLGEDTTLRVRANHAVATVLGDGAALRARLAAEPRAAVGEIGLDRWMLDRARPDDPRLAGLRRAPLEEQGEVFLKQLALAASEDRPVTIHCLQAYGALEGVLRHVSTPARGFLLHAYGGPAELVPVFAERGAYFSFNGAFLAERHAAKLEAFRRVPADRLLVETDAPAMPLPPERATHALPPAPDGSAVNHPANLAAAYGGLAELRGLTPPALAAQVEENFVRFFGA